LLPLNDQALSKVYDERFRLAFKVKPEVRDKGALEKIRTEFYRGLISRFLVSEVMKKHKTEYPDEILSKEELDAKLENIKSEKGGNADKAMLNFNEKLKNAYDYMEKHHGANAAKEAYEKYLTPLKISLYSWECMLKNPDHKSYTFKQVAEYGARLSGVLTPEIVREEKERLLDEKLPEFVLKKMKEYDKSVAEYLQNKEKTGQRDKKFEDNKYMEWLSNQALKDAKLYTDKYGTLREILFGWKNDIFSSVW